MYIYYIYTHTCTYIYIYILIIIIITNYIYCSAMGREAAAVRLGRLRAAVPTWRMSRVNIYCYKNCNSMILLSNAKKKTHTHTHTRNCNIIIRYNAGSTWRMSRQDKSIATFRANIRRYNSYNVIRFHNNN